MTKKINFFLALLPILYYIYISDLPLLAHHSFRQTQTAFLVLSYDLYGVEFLPNFPLFGYPWKMGLEFPIYQFFTFIIYKINILSLDNSGRFVSLLFYYLSFIPISRICKLTGIEKSRDIFYFLYLASPLLFFFSSSFLIETTLLFFILSSVLFFLKIINNYSNINFLLLLFCLTITGLSKITSLPAMLITFTIVTLIKFRKTFFSVKPIILIIVFIISSVISLSWSIIATNFNSENILLSNSELVTGGVIYSWLFGTFEQRIDPHFYFMIFFRGFILSSMFVPLIYTLSISNKIGSFSCFFESKNLHILIFLLIPILSLVIFSNLYFVHDYYFISIIPLLILFFCSLYEKSFFITKFRLNYFLIIYLLCSILIFFGYYFKKNNFRDFENEFLEISNYLVNKINKDDFIIIDNNGNWNPIISYYSKAPSIYVLKSRNIQFILDNINEVGKNKNLKFLISCDPNNFSYISNHYGDFDYKTENCVLWKIKKPKF